MTADPVAKADLRARMRALRRDLAALQPAAAEAAALHLPLEDVAGAGVASGYHALGAEMDPWPVLRRLAAQGARLALPVATAVDAPLLFRAYADGQALAPDAARIPAPTADAEILTPQLVIAPLLAFDDDGYRLGQGGGYYDRTLQALRASSPLLVIGLAYAGQRIERVPREAHDQPLDAILTESGYHRIRKG